MTAIAKTSDLSRFCSICARQSGLDSGGSAYVYDHVLAVEIPLPWPMSMYSEPGVLPQELLDLRKLLVESYQQGNPLKLSSFAIAPDAAYSRPGYRRVLSYQRPSGPCATFTQEEYLVPEVELGQLCWALLVKHDTLSDFADYRQPLSGVRDLLVCTHGAVDAACAKFGFPIYRQLRRLSDQSHEQVRVWRVSHFGGHVFAPTLLDMPEFRYWGYVEREEAEQLFHRQGDVVHLRECYRGWAALDSPFLQVAERELFVRHGWSWLTYLKQGFVLAQDEAVAPKDHGDQSSWAEVRIEYTALNNSESGVYLARVELDSPIDCVHSTGEPDTYPHPQYVVTRLERVA